MSSTPAPNEPAVPGLKANAPGKLNLCLLLGPTRADGRHELVSVICSLSLADELALAADGGNGDAGDEVVCAGVAGPNLAADALAAYRAETGWHGPSVRLAIDKRVPVAAGMGGGSGDAAATLRLAAHAAGRPGDPAVAAIAPRLGADVPSQLEPGTMLVAGAGERIERRLSPPALGVLVLPSSARLSTPDVYREADRLGLPRTAPALAEARARLEAALGDAADAGALPDDLLVNDLAPAARSLCPAIVPALAAAREAGADVALVSGSGPTVAGLFRGADGPSRARAAAADVRRDWPQAIAAEPVDAAFGQPRAATDPVAT